jgi:hypothetical protein
VRGTVGGASSTCRLWERRRGGGHLMMRKRRGWDTGSVQLQLGARGQWTAARGAAASRGAVARSDEEDDPEWARLVQTAG